MAEVKKNIVFAGGIFKDLIAYADRFPKVGETMTGTKFQTGFGGKSANQAVMCSRLGGHSTILGMVGNDDIGKSHFDNFKSNNVDTTFLGVSESEASGVAAIIVDNSTGQNRIIIIPGASNDLSPESIDKSESVFKDAGAVVVGLEVPHEAIIRVLELARKHSVLTITNAAPAKSDLDPRIFQFTDILCVNETEAEIITGRTTPMTTDADIEEVSKQLIEKCPTVVLTLGSKGSVLMNRANPKVMSVQANQVDNVVDTTGAGDSFVGAMAYYLVEHSHLEMTEIIRRSGSIATISVQKEGTQSSFPYKKDLSPDLF